MGICRVYSSREISTKEKCMQTDVVGELVTVLCTVQWNSTSIEGDFVRRAFGSSSSLQYVVSTDNRISRQPLHRKCLYFGKNSRPCRERLYGELRVCLIFERLYNHLQCRPSIRHALFVPWKDTS